jgi:hypothetical protein
MDAVPIALLATAANGRNPAVILDRTDVDFAIIAFHFATNIIGGQRPPLQQRGGEIQAINFLFLKCQVAKLSVSRTSEQMIVYHPCSLHERIADS